MLPSNSKFDASSIFVWPWGAFILCCVPVQKSSSDKQQQIFHPNSNKYETWRQNNRNDDSSNPPYWNFYVWRHKPGWVILKYLLCLSLLPISWCTFANQNSPQFNYFFNITLAAIFQLIKLNSVGLWIKSDI